MFEKNETKFHFFNKWKWSVRVNVVWVKSLAPKFGDFDENKKCKRWVHLTTWPVAPQRPHLQASKRFLNPKLALKIHSRVSRNNFTENELKYVLGIAREAYKIGVKRPMQKSLHVGRYIPRYIKWQFLHAVLKGLVFWYKIFAPI